MAKKDAVTKEEAKSDAVTTYDYGDDLGAGFEDTTQDDYAMPFLTVIQDLTPAYKDGLVEGAKLGMFLNTATNTIHSGEKGIIGVPCFRKRAFLEWSPRSAGGGYVGEHEPDSQVVQDAKDAATEYGKYKVGNNDLVETFTVYWVLLDESGEIMGQVVSSYKSMFIKKYKNFMTTANQIRINGKTAPIFAHKYRLKTLSETKPGGTFFNWDIRLEGKDAASSRLNPLSEVYLAARVLHQMAKEGKTKVDHNKDSGETTNPEDTKQY